MKTTIPIVAPPTPKKEVVDVKRKPTPKPTAKELLSPNPRRRSQDYREVNYY